MLKNWSVLKNHCKHVEKMENAETMKNAAKNLTQYRATQTNTLIQNYFGKNLPKYSILTLIGVQHCPPVIKRGKWKSTRNGGVKRKITYK